jgi:hypothetical protein
VGQDFWQLKTVVELELFSRMDVAQIGGQASWKRKYLASEVRFIETVVSQHLAGICCRRFCALERNSDAPTQNPDSGG